MALEIIKVYTEDLPALRFIGKDCGRDNKVFVAKWNEWFENGWFEQLEKLGPAPKIGDKYIGATEKGYWIGMLFPAGTPVPDGFEFKEIPASRYAVFRLSGKKEGELLNEDGGGLCAEEIRRRGWIPIKWNNNGWAFDRYICPPAKRINMLYDFWIMIE